MSHPFPFAYGVRDIPMSFVGIGYLQLTDARRNTRENAVFTALLERD